MAISLRELQVISRRGKPTAVVIPIKDFQELLDLAEDRYKEFHRLPRQLQIRIARVLLAL